MMHRGSWSTKSHFVAETIYPVHSGPRAIAVCGQYDVITALPEYAALDFVCKRCLAKIGKSIERMALTSWPGYTTEAQAYERSTR